MRRRLAALVLSAALPLSLAGCFGLGEATDVASDVADAASSLADQAEEAANALSSVEWGKLSRAVILDASTGEQVAEITDQAAIEAAFEPLSGVNGVAARPGEAQEEYVIELWQPSTALLGQDASDVEEVKVLEVVTYEGSDTLGVRVPLVGISLYLSAQEGTADALRALAG